ncbi:MAG: hypothetical protein HC898_11270, partial [Phycisphaerales bacterium]|nr:hypothetical protein [Phycisphaerales bacterium]
PRLMSATHRQPTPVIDGGPMMKRFQPKDRGRAHRILKRTSHIIVSVDVG